MVRKQTQAFAPLLFYVFIETLPTFLPVKNILPMLHVCAEILSACGVYLALTVVDKTRV